jgi:hypothetical protein
MTRPEPERTALVIDGARGIASDYLRRSDPHHFHAVADHIGSERSHAVSASELDAHVDGAKFASLLVQIDQLYDQALLIMGILIDCGQRGAAQRRRY